MANNITFRQQIKVHQYMHAYIILHFMKYKKKYNHML